MTSQFDICRLRRSGRNSSAGLVVVLQHRELDDIGTVLVAPLVRGLAPEKRPRLHPPIEDGDGHAFLAVERMAAIDRKELGAVVGSAAPHAEAIKRAIDLAFLGF